MTLDELALKYGTDKASNAHDYARVYDTFFTPLRYKPITLLEIGVDIEAKSLKVWEEYFPYGRILGIDINPACKKHESDRIQIIVGDQSDRVFLETLVFIDIVIDDGSHQSPHQIVSMEALLPRMNPGGMYAIEDLGCSFGSNGDIRKVLHKITDRMLRATRHVRPEIESMHYSRQLCVMVKR